MWNPFSVAKPKTEWLLQPILICRREQNHIAGSWPKKNYNWGNVHEKDYDWGNVHGLILLQGIWSVYDDYKQQKRNRKKIKGRCLGLFVTSCDPAACTRHSKTYTDLHKNYQILKSKESGISNIRRSGRITALRVPWGIVM